jgi:cytochrome b
MPEETTPIKRVKPQPPKLIAFRLYERYRFVIYGILTGVALNLIWGVLGEQPSRYSPLALLLAFGIIGFLLIVALNRRMIDGRK